MNKFQRILWTINGVLILLTLLFAIYKISEEQIRMSSYRSAREIIVGEELKEAKEKGLILQGLDYDSPIPVYGSSSYILPIRIKTYDTPREYDNEYALADDDSKMIKLNVETVYSLVNIIFTNSNFSTSHALLDKKAFITSFSYPAFEDDYSDYGKLDTSIQYITYLIGFQDSNKDELLDRNDDSDLYISDLDGTNLIQVTTGINIIDYKFLSPNELLIEYFKRNDKPQEHKRKFFVKYFIKEKRLEELTLLHQTLDNLEKAITK